MHFLHGILGKTNILHFDDARLNHVCCCCHVSMPHCKRHHCLVRQLNGSLGHLHPYSSPIWFLADVQPGGTIVMFQVHGSVPSTWETWNEFLAPNFYPLQPWLLQAFKCGGISVCVSFFLCVSHTHFSQIKLNE